MPQSHFAGRTTDTAVINKGNTYFLWIGALKIVLNLFDIGIPIQSLSIYK